MKKARGPIGPLTTANFRQQGLICEVMLILKNPVNPV